MAILTDQKTAAEPVLEPVRDQSIIVIEPQTGWVSINLREIWAFRDLLFFLAWRDISVRYKQTILGIAWAIIQPFFSMIVFSLFFGRLAKVPSDGLPYPLFSYAALLPWQYFSTALGSSANSLVGSSSIITKTYFPRLTIPLAAILTPLFDFVIAFSFLILMMIYYHVTPTWHIVWLPFLLLLAMVTALGVGLWLSAMNVQYRDVKYAIGFLIQLWMFASPVVYSTTLVPPEWRIIYGLNPMAGVISGFRWALLGTQNGPDYMMIVSIVVAILILIGGAFYFRRMEKTFADKI
jgi:homopolymeric O-antigen transport system permease protein